MAILACTAIIGFLCVQSSIGDTMTITHQDAGIFVADTIQTRAWTLSYGRSTERPPLKLDPAKMAKACSDAGCEVYWRKCNEVAHECSFALATDGGGSVSFQVTAKDAAGLKLAMGQIAIELGNTPGNAISLGALDHESAEPDAPAIGAAP